MTQPELDALYAVYDRWDAYSLLKLILAMGLGIALTIIGLVALWDDRTGVAAILSTVGIALVAAGLHSRPFEAR